jgi:hypothetical protein
MAQTLKILIMVFGAVCMGIALVHIGVGPRSIPGSIPVNATMDSEDRFYATLFLGFGAACIWAARDLTGRAKAFDALMLVFFLGGIARIISAAMVGVPSSLFVLLGGLELVLPLLFVWMHRQACARRQSPSRRSWNGL